MRSWCDLARATAGGVTLLSLIALPAGADFNDKSPINYTVDGATAQGYFTLAMGLVMAGTMSLSGTMYEAFGIRAYAVMAAAAFIGGALALVAHRLRGGE